MLSLRALFILSLHSCVAARNYGPYADNGPRSVGELVGLAYLDQEAPEYIKLPGPADIAVAFNGSAALAMEFLHIEPYPLQAGQNTFTLSSVLRRAIPEGGVIELRAFNGWTPVFEGNISLCDYTRFLKLDCPIETESWGRLLERRLLIPGTATTGRYSFKAEVWTPARDLVFMMLGIIDLDGDSVQHEEL